MCWFWMLMLNWRSTCSFVDWENAPTAQAKEPVLKKKKKEKNSLDTLENARHAAENKLTF